MSDLYFGLPWASRVTHPRGTRIPTPVGDDCLQCTEKILAADRGVITSSIHVVHRTTLAGSLAPVHLECHVRVAVGSLAYLLGARHLPPWQGTFHAESLAVLAEINRLRQAQGVGPL
jgi:hypothetical protein